MGARFQLEKLDVNTIYQLLMQYFIQGSTAFLYAQKDLLIIVYCQSRWLHLYWTNV